MRKHFLCLLILLVAQLTFAQINQREVSPQTLEEQNVAVPDIDTAVEKTIYSQYEVEQKAEFPGGVQNFYKFVAKTFVVPNEPGLNGKVFMSFTIEKDGSITDIKVIRDFGYGTGAEAIKMMRKSPKWIPAKLNGQTVRSTFSFPIAIMTNPSR